MEGSNAYVRMHQLEPYLYVRDCTNIVGVWERREGVLGPNGGHGSERSAESSSRKSGTSDGSDHFGSEICVSVNKVLRIVPVYEILWTVRLVRQLEARDDIILRWGCGSEALLLRRQLHRPVIEIILRHSHHHPAYPRTNAEFQGTSVLTREIHLHNNKRRLLFIYLLHLLPIQYPPN